ncbi:polysaccharide pyruvyl transferase family protein [Clostridium beijerinckii]|uniref:polysaccharide pyruvyl transferase family protein n=1 Tax=Clostridium beijerinckii TaxID=1520 RepID=UPI001494FCF3|nr:hypothetical protein [Clostridium beijerinckii]NOW88967.1 hypothetical protein [Clostridium beijerinckii]NYC00347.1 hypothetical protein [Clostridium beijerinckii]
MKVGVITFQQSNNYGAILQSYALQTVINKLGHEGELIDYKCDYIGKPYKLINLRKKGFFSYIFGVIGFICYLPRKKNCNLFRKNMVISRTVNKVNVKELNDVYDIFIAGSDQVWNYKLTNSDSTYLLDFVKDNNKKFSYAASFGISSIENEQKKNYGKLLKTFNNIYLREEKGIDIVKDLCGREATVVLDPTLLLKKEEWMNVTKECEISVDYILVYQLGISAKLIDFINNLAKMKKCKVVYIPFPIGKYIKCKWSLFAGPSEWLGLFKNAKYVVTDSFHGTVFSILFNKSFFTEICGQNKGVGSRIENFIEKFGLKDRLVIDGINNNIDDEIDYIRVNKVLEEEREKSLACLRNILQKQ